jgi:hypothetical protein
MDLRVFVGFVLCRGQALIEDYETAVGHSARVMDSNIDTN